MSRLFDFNHPFFRPLWIRVLVVGLCAGWTVVELASGNAFWAILFGAVAVAAFWGLFVTFNPREPDK